MEEEAATGGGGRGAGPSVHGFHGGRRRRVGRSDGERESRRRERIGVRREGEVGRMEARNNGIAGT